MIYLNLLFDSFINILLPIKTYFIIFEIEKNKIYEVITVPLLIDIYYKSIPYNTITILLIYLLMKKLKVDGLYLKNIIAFLLYFLIVQILSYNFYDIFLLIYSLLIYVFYIFIISHIIYW